ncbi:hypothetical protein THAOC_20872 [Thalassiosira oceanica]|uniref:Uncharacterized protein n=1 Tax=Thalassiosira oceanica TaxID=159749 RepID=K0SDC8_THAOC|nr:hypothetical protein THAOC_20872 [Thalassiosira oceanica]|eukprot:EJK58961.1 hypothetical protein THAOC_20872 [Thalassiosira oceanica]
MMGADNVQTRTKVAAKHCTAKAVSIVVAKTKEERVDEEKKHLLATLAGESVADVVCPSLGQISFPLTTDSTERPRELYGGDTAHEGQRFELPEQGRARPNQTSRPRATGGTGAIMASESARASPNDYMDTDAAGLPPRPSPPNNMPAPQETDVADGIVATPMVQEVPPGDMSAPTIRALTDDEPPIPVWHVVDHEKVTEAPHQHDGPPGLPCFPRDSDGDSFARKLENEVERELSIHRRDNTSTGASVASAAAMGSSMDERVGERGVSSRGIASPTSLHTDTAAVVDLPSVGHPTFIAEGYRVAESDETPVYEAEVAEPKAVLPLYQRTGFVFVMVAITLLAIGVVVGVLLSNNFDKNTGGPKAPIDGTLGQTAVNSPLPEDPVIGQTAVNSLAPSSAPVTLFGFGDYLQIGDWSLAPTCENCSSSHLRISSQATGKTSQIFLNVGTDLPGGKGYNGFDNLTGGQELTYSTEPIIFGDRAVQIRDWRIRQVRFDLLSVTNENGNVSRIYRSDGTVRGNAKEWGGYVIKDLGEPTCAYLTSSFLQLGEWRFGEMEDHHGRALLSVTHKSGQTGPRTDFNAWTLVDDEVLAGTKKGCNVGAPAAAAHAGAPTISGSTVTTSVPGE